jgi:predicted nucleotide-binding protein
VVLGATQTDRGCPRWSVGDQPGHRVGASFASLPIETGMLVSVKGTTAQKLLRLREQITAANYGDPDDFEGWKAKSEVVLRHAVGDDDQLVHDFRKNRYSLGASSERTTREEFAEARRRGVRRAIALLEAAKTKVELIDDAEPQRSAGNNAAARTEIFIVHGRDQGRKEMVARFVQDLTGRTPIILHEKASGGTTLIEKLERYAPTIAFAVVVATGDDIGRVADSRESAERPRARQNVILELGYFMALLGRKNVVLLLEPGLERPSDTDGIVYAELDSGSRGWRIDLARELEDAGIEVDRSAIR